MKSKGKILVAFGVVALLCAGTSLFIFDHVSSPWGAGTSPGGLSDDDGAAFEQVLQWQLRVFGLLIGTGLAGAVLLVAGSLSWLIAQGRILLRPC